jgi:S1-C subfamily serine protease
MNRFSAGIAIALAFAALPSASIAQTPAAGIGVAFVYEMNKAKVAEVMPGGTADMMGVRAGDIVTHAGGKRVTSQGRMSAFFRSLKVGDPVTLTVKRKGKSLQLTGKAVARTW